MKLPEKTTRSVLVDDHTMDVLEQFKARGYSLAQFIRIAALQPEVFLQLHESIITSRAGPVWAVPSDDPRVRLEEMRKVRDTLRDAFKNYGRRVASDAPDLVPYIAELKELTARCDIAFKAKAYDAIMTDIKPRSEEIIAALVEGFGKRSEQALGQLLPLAEQFDQPKPASKPEPEPAPEVRSFRYRPLAVLGKDIAELEALESLTPKQQEVLAAFKRELALREIEDSA
jgi:hypothetical protein